MDIAYYKRFRMEIKLAGRDLRLPPLPAHYLLIPWDESLLDAFARAKYRSFRDELDASVFPCLGEFEGCRRLMSEIVRKPGFLPQATWLGVCSTGGPHRAEYCGTVQGVRDQHGLGAIQNLGTVPEHRNLGLGRSLMLMALEGFRKVGVQRVYLEVTAQNQAAIRLYRRIGFDIIRTVYKAVEAEYSK
jgi:GNAT superfamily N-acetyltransferase